MKQFYLLATALATLNTIPLHSQVTLSADGPGNTYSLIESRGFGVESPDCGHTAFGPHVTELFDNTLNKNVFVFHSHATADDDRCSADDRVRMEIKGGAGSPAALQHTEGQTAYYRWKFKLDAGFIPSSRFTHIFQIKAYGGDDGAPLITITPRAGNPQKMQIIHSAGEGSGSLGTVHQVDLAPFKGTWVEAYVKYKSSEGSAGTFEVSIKRVSDGAVLLSYSRTGIDLWRTDAEYNRPKWGVYRGKDAVLRDEQVRFADFCVSESAFVLKNQQTTQGRLLWNSKETGSNVPQIVVTTSSARRINAKLQTTPNPFNKVNTITFTLQQPSQVRLTMHDLTGKQVMSLLNGNMQAGIHQKVVSAPQLSTGIYFIRLAYDDKVLTKKLIKE